MVLSQEWTSWICHLAAEIPSHSFSNSFCCLCSVVSFWVWMPWASSNASIMPGHTSASGTQLQLPLLPLGSSSSESEGMPYYFSLQWWHSCCHCASQCRHSVSSNLEAMTPLQHVGHGSSHSTSHWWIWYSSMHVWFQMRRCQLLCYPWWWLLHHIQ